MTEKYFEKFPTITYDGTTAIDITKRVAFLNKIYNDPNLYYPYSVVDGERADNISDRYYDDQHISWLLYLTNGVIDPKEDWYIDEASFNRNLILKYGSIEYSKLKVEFFRNNWYVEQEPITSAQFETLPDSSRIYYEPYQNDIDIKFYSRKKIDWTVATNIVVNAQISSSQDFTPGEVVTGNGYSATVSSVSSTFVLLEKTTGPISNGVMTGKISGKTANVTSSSVVSQSIPDEELQFWSPVTSYDVEYEKNEYNRTIRVLNNAYALQSARELKRLLK